MGHPKGGIGILWKKSMVDCVTFKKIPNTDRACTIQIKCGNDDILCINMYMPVDNQGKLHVDTDFSDTINALDMFIEQCKVRNIVLAGDFNIDFNCKNAHDIYFKDYCQSRNIKYAFDLPIADKG